MHLSGRKKKTNPHCKNERMTDVYFVILPQKMQKSNYTYFISVTTFFLLKMGVELCVK